MSSAELRAALDLDLAAFEGAYRGELAVIRAETRLSNLRIPRYEWPSGGRIWSRWQVGYGRGAGYTSGSGRLMPEFELMSPVEILEQPKTVIRKP